MSWGNFAEHGDFPRKPVNVGHGEIHLGFLRDRQQMQDRIG